MIKKSKSIISNFYFKRETNLDSDGNSVYVLLPSESLNKESLNNENLLYIHLPQDENIDKLNFLIEDKNNINTSYMDFETPINFYLRETEARTIVIDLGVKMAMDKDLKLYIEGVAQFRPNKNHYNIGFHDDPKLPVFGNNKVFIKDLTIEGVNNCNLLFRRDKYNSEKYAMKSLVWGNDNDMNYCIAAEYAFIKIYENKTIYDDVSILSDGARILFGNLSGKPSKTLIFKDSTLKCDTNGNDIVEFSAPSVSLSNCEIVVANPEGETALNRIVRDSTSITFNNISIDVTGMLETTSETGLYAIEKYDKRGSLANNSITTIKAGKGPIFFKGSAIFENAHIKSDTPITIDNSSIKNSIIKNPIIKDTSNEVFSSDKVFSIEQSYINNSTIEEPKFESNSSIYRVYLNSFQLIRPTFNYINKDLEDGYNLDLTSDLAFSRPVAEDCIFTLSEFSKTIIDFTNPTFSEGFNGPDSNEKTIKSCAFYGENKISIKKAFDFANNIFKETESTFVAGSNPENVKNGIYNSEFSGKNILKNIPEPISNAIFSNAEATNVSGLSNSFVKNYKGENRSFNSRDQADIDKSSVADQSLEVL